jgi:prepilin-type N-terminal cleavage/methylation domain-containing protein
MNGSPRNHGFSLIEATIAVALVGLMLVAALNSVGASAKARQIHADHAKARLLASDLMAEILATVYEDPEYGQGTFGTEDEDIGDGSRAFWDDVDDYDGWSATPPQLKNGTEFPDLTDWTRSVTVDWVNQSNLSMESVVDTRLKRVEVVVTRGDAVLATLKAVRAADWDEAQ